MLLCLIASKKMNKNMLKRKSIVVFDWLIHPNLISYLTPNFIYITAIKLQVVTYILLFFYKKSKMFYLIFMINKFMLLWKLFGQNIQNKYWKCFVQFERYFWIYIFIFFATINMRIWGSWCWVYWTECSWNIDVLTHP